MLTVKMEAVFFLAGDFEGDHFLGALERDGIVVLLLF